MHYTIRGFKTLDINIKNKSGIDQTLLEYFAMLLVNVGDIRTQLIQQTKRATDNIIYLIHQKEHSVTVKTLIKNLDVYLSKNFTKEALRASKREYMESNRVMNKHSTPATRKNAALLKSLFGDPAQQQNTRPPPRSNQRKSIQAQYPHEYSKLPTGKSNAWDDLRAKQKKEATKPTDEWTQNITSTPPYVMSSYQPTPILKKPTTPVEITDLQRQTMSMKKDNVETRQLMITNKQDISKEVT